MWVHTVLDIFIYCILSQIRNLIAPSTNHSYNFCNDGALRGHLDLMLEHHGLTEHILMLDILIQKLVGDS